jgi:hypothetical protein
MNDVLCALLRTDLASFIHKVFYTVFPGSTYLPNWHIDAIVHQLLQVERGRCPRLLINQPPRSLKSLSVSVAYVAWLLGHDPGRRIIVVSYSNDLAAELHRQFRMVVDSAWYGDLFPGMRTARDTGTEFVTTAGGSRYATSVGGTLTGRGADLIIIDDPLKAEEALSESARKRVIDWYRHWFPGSTIKIRVQLLSLCSACTKMTSQGIFWRQAGGSISTFPPLRPRMPRSRWAAAGCTSVVPERCFIRRAKANSSWTASRQKSAACSSRRNTSSVPSPSRGI